MKKQLIVLIAAVWVAFGSLAAPVNGFKYQAVVRNNQGVVIENSAVLLRVSILQGSENGTSVYSEQHEVTTNAFGLINVIIGNGTSPMGNFTTIDWSGNSYFLKVEMAVAPSSTLELLGVSPLLSVPYALHAETVANNNDADADPVNEIQQITLSGTTLSITQSNSVDLTPLVTSDTDEQTLDLTADELSISNGNSVNLAPYKDNTDAQNLNLTGTTLAISGGNTVDLSTLPDLVNDADADPTNEIQSLSIAIDQLSISGGNQVDLSPYKDNTDAQTLNLTGTSLSITGGNNIDLSPLQDGVTDADADPTNEIQSLSIATDQLSISGSNQVDLSSYKDNTDAQNLDLTGTILTITGGNSVDLSTLPDSVNDADADPINEIQDLILTGSTLKITNNASATEINLAPFAGTNTDEQTLYIDDDSLGITNGNKVLLPKQDLIWDTAGTAIFYNEGNVGIGTTNPVTKLHVVGTQNITSTIESNDTIATSLEISNTTVSNKYQLSLGGSANTAPGAFCLFDSFAGLPRILVQQNGNIGIGTANPGSYKFYVNGGDMMVNRGDGLGGNIKIAGHSFVGSADWGDLRLASGVNSGNTSIRFITENAERVFITGNGDVGIGVWPTHRLQVNGNTFINGNALVNGSINGQVSTGFGDVLFVGNDSKLADINVANTLAVYGLQNNAVATLRLGSSAADISGSVGNVGIGTTTPTEKLELGGTNSRLYLNSTTSNHILFNAHGVAPPTMTTRSAGTKLVLYPNVSNSSVDFGLGIENSTLWLSIPSASSVQAFKFYGGTTELMRIRGDGNVGIGTTNPAYKLHTVGDIYANGGWLRVSGNAGLYFESWGGGWYMSDATWIRSYNNKNIYHNTGIMRTDGTFQVGDNGSTLSVTNGGSFAYRSNVLFANASGNIGIGTATPSARMVVQGSSTDPTVPLFVVNNRLGQPVFLVYQDSVRIIVKDDYTKGSKGVLAVSGRNTSKALTGSFMVINSDNTMIGQLAGSTITSGLRNVFLGAGSGYSNTSGADNTYIGTNAGRLMTSASANIAIGKDAGYGSVYRLYHGNVFIGNSAGYEGTGQFNVMIGNNAGYYNNGGANVFIGNGAGQYVEGTDNILIGTLAGGSSSVTLNSELRIAGAFGTVNLITGNFGSQRVGIMRLAAANNFEVEGTASKTTAGLWLANSDRRIKTDIRDISNAFETILKLHPVYFKYTDEYIKQHPSIEEKYYYNFIAQEFQNVFPDAVKGSGEFLEGTKDEILQLDSYSAQIVSIKAVQELITELDAQKKLNAELLIRIESLEKRFSNVTNTPSEENHLNN